jgi:hypothetical protein
MTGELALRFLLCVFAEAGPVHGVVAGIRTAVEETSSGCIPVCVIALTAV